MIIPAWTLRAFLIGLFILFAFACYGGSAFIE